MMRLMQTMSMRQMCPCCDGALDDHSDGCPVLAIKQYVASMESCYHICRVCHDMRVRPNRADFYECPKCGIMYTTSEVGEGSAETTTLLRADMEGVTLVRALSERGTGDFMDKEVLISLRQLAQDVRRRRAQ